MKYRYFSIAQLVLLATFFTAVLPLVLPVTIAGLVAVYFVHKYILLRRCKPPVVKDTAIAKQMLDILDLIPLSYAIGNITLQELMNYHHTEQMDRTLLIPI